MTDLGTNKICSGANARLGFNDRFEIIDTPYMYMGRYDPKKGKKRRKMTF